MLEISFKVDTSSVQEVINEQEKPEKAAQKLAFQKAEEVSKRHPNSIVMGADTIVVLDDSILGKPKNKQQAIKILNRLSNRTHCVITGVALLKTNDSAGIIKKKLFHEQTTVTFGKLSSAIIKQYVQNGQPMDKAGAYGIQDKWGAIFTERIEGDFYNVMGLPLRNLYHHLTLFV